MRICSILAIAASAATLAACGQPPAAGSGNGQDIANGVAADEGTPSGTADSATGMAPLGNDDMSAPADDATTTGDSDADPGSPEAAAAVVERYYDAIDDGDFRKAYALWGNGGKASDQSFDQFRQGFAQTDDSDVTVGTPERPEGAAGSVYITVPVTIEAELKDGTEQHFTGSYTLRRVNNVPGSTAEQRRWHLHSADLTKG